MDDMEPLISAMKKMCLTSFHGDIPVWSIVACGGVVFERCVEVWHIPPFRMLRPNRE